RAPRREQPARARLSRRSGCAPGPTQRRKRRYRRTNTRMNPARSPAPLAGTTPLLLDEQTSPVVLRFPLLESVPGFRHAVTTRLGGASLAPYGACNLGLSTGEAQATVLANRASVATLVAERSVQPATARQVHGVAAI